MLLIPKVSIIIPVYNTEEYIEEAIKSILNQTLDNIEIIIINDGSTDNSPSIISTIAKQDKRIRNYSQENQGPSITRNIGLKHAIGEYIYFMDSDDYLEPGALEECYKKCNNYNLDFIFFDADILNKNNNYSLNLTYQRKDYTNENTLYKGIDVFNILLDNNCYSPSACLNFISRNYIDKIKLSFRPGIIHEDQLFTGQLYLQALKVMCIHQDFFKRRLRNNSIMTKEFSIINVNSYFIIADEFLKFASNHLETQKTINKLLFQMLNAVVWLSYRLSLKERIYIARICITKYNIYISAKNIFILLFKSCIKK